MFKLPGESSGRASFEPVAPRRQRPVRRPAFLSTVAFAATLNLNSSVALTPLFVTAMLHLQSSFAALELNHHTAGFDLAAFGIPPYGLHAPQPSLPTVGDEGDLHLLPGAQLAGDIGNVLRLSRHDDGNMPIGVLRLDHDAQVCAVADRHLSQPHKRTTHLTDPGRTLSNRQTAQHQRPNQPNH